MSVVALLHPLKCQDKHRVAREDGRIGIPAHVYRLLSAAQRGVVHEVVMQERVVVIGLKGARRRENRFRVVPEEIVGQEHQRRTYALSSQREYISDRFVQALWPASVREIAYILVYFVENFISSVHDRAFG